MQPEKGQAQETDLLSHQEKIEYGLKSQILDEWG